MKLPYVSNLLVAAIMFNLSNKEQYSFPIITGIFKIKKILSSSYKTDLTAMGANQ